MLSKVVNIISHNHAHRLISQMITESVRLIILSIMVYLHVWGAHVCVICVSICGDWRLVASVLLS